MKLLAALALIPILSGCAFSGLVSKETKVANDQASCIGYGFTPGTEAFAVCMMRMDEIRREDDKDRRIALANALGDMADRMRTPPPMLSTGFTCETTPQFSGILGAPPSGNSTTRCY